MIVETSTKADGTCNIKKFTCDSDSDLSSITGVIPFGSEALILNSGNIAVKVYNGSSWISL